MANKITIQHYYTTGSTAPAASALTLGEIAIATSAGTEAIFIKNNTGTIVDFPTRKQIVDYVDLKTKGIATSGEIETLDNKISGHITGLSSTDNFGHVKLVGGDLDWATGNTITSGEAAASYHTHGQYLETISLNTNDGGLKKTPGLNGTPASYGVKAGTGISVDSNGVSINDEYQGKIASGVTAYGWGNHTSAGYAKNTDLTTLRNSVTAHTGNTTVHITGEERTNWNNAANRINTFLDVETGATAALDSLHEIQEYLTGSGNSVNTLLESLNNLTDTVSGNTDDITSLKGEFGDNGSVTLLEKDVLRKVEEIDTEGNISATPGVTSTGSGAKKYTITHTPASTQASAITVTNSNEVISFGSTFDIVNKIAYDANGHVVSGSTQTLTLPNLLTATTDNYGVVKLKSGELTLVDELINEDSSKTAAGVAHGHTEYVKYADLNDYKGTTPLVISCGTY